MSPPRRFYIAQVTIEVLFAVLIILFFAPNTLTAELPIGGAISAESIQSPFTTVWRAGIVVFLILVMTAIGFGSVYPVVSNHWQSISRNN